MSQAALRVIRPVMRATSTLAPHLAGRLAFRLFCTPIGRPQLNPRNPAIRQALEIEKQGKLRKMAYASGYITTRWFEPEGEIRGTVLLLHGWTSRGLFMNAFVAPLLARGYRAVTMDLPGHGASSGARLNIPLAIDALKAVTRAHWPLAGIIAHSFGGAVAMAAIAGGLPAFDSVPNRRLVVIGTPNSVLQVGQNFSHAVGLSRRGHRAFEARAWHIAGVPMDTIVGAAYLARTRMPTLVLHAPDDKEVPYREAEALAKAGDFVRLQPMPGLGHRRILFSPDVAERAAAFIES